MEGSKQWGKITDTKLLLLLFSFSLSLFPFRKVKVHRPAAGPFVVVVSAAGRISDLLLFVSLSLPPNLGLHRVRMRHDHHHNDGHQTYRRGSHLVNEVVND